MATAQQRIAALDQLFELTVLLGDDMNRSLTRDGLTVARAHLLWVLQQRGPSTQRVLADALGVSPRNVTGLVDALVATGFVTREPHPSDRRATLVTLTEHGTSMTRAMADGQQDLARALFAGMPRGQFEGLVEGLGVVLARLREEVAKAAVTAQSPATREAHADPMSRTPRGGDRS